MSLSAIFVFMSFAYSLGNPISGDLFELSVVHINDFHARFAETSSSSGDCKNSSTCIGGFSRLYTQIQSILAEKPNSVLLNGGDNFQGTLYYTLGKWNITQEFINKLPFDAIVLGNHEFEDGVAGLVPFIKALKAPVICANIDDSQEPDIQGIYTKSTVIKRNGKKIGIIGVLYSKTNELANTGKLSFYPESEAVNAEADRLVRNEGVFTNIVLSHVGYDIDQQIASNASQKIGLIVGAHSHTFLYTGDNPPGPDTPQGPYPTTIKSKNGKNVLIVQASAFTKYLGNITVFYNSDGETADYEGAPIFLDTSKPKNDDIDTDLEPWSELVDAEGSVVVGSTLVKLENGGCYYQECTIGNFVTDAYVFAYAYAVNVQQDAWTQAAIGLISAGSFRSGIEIGNITYSDLLTSQPFGNTVNLGDLQGRYIKEALEYGAAKYNAQTNDLELNLLQVSGIHVVYNLTRPVGDRVQNLKIRCQKCEVPLYEEVDLNATYKIAISSYIAGGGDGFTTFSDNIKNEIIGGVDMDLFRRYLQYRSPVFEEIEGRITVISQNQIRTKDFD